MNKNYKELSIAANIKWDTESFNLPSEIKGDTFENVKNKIKEIENKYNCHVKGYQLFKSIPYIKNSYIKNKKGEK